MTYERDLDNLLKSERFKTRAQLVDELRNRVGSFDAQITKTVQEGDPSLRHITVDLQSTGQEVLAMTGKLEAKSWDRVEHDHRRARRLSSAAEWSLSIVSAITLLVSIWISFTLPKQVVKPLIISLKEAVDRTPPCRTPTKSSSTSRVKAKSSSSPTASASSSPTSAKPPTTPKAASPATLLTRRRLGVRDSSQVPPPQLLTEGLNAAAPGPRIPTIIAADRFSDRGI